MAATPLIGKDLAPTGVGLPAPHHLQRVVRRVHVSVLSALLHSEAEAV